MLLPVAYLILIKMAASGVEHLSFRRFLNAPEQRRIPGRRSVVVPQQNSGGICIGADDCDGLVPLQGQDPIIFQEHHALPCHFPAESDVFRRFHHVHADPVVGAVLIEHSQTEPGFHDPFRRPGDGLLVDQTLFIGHQQIGVSASAV